MSDATRQAMVEAIEAHLRDENDMAEEEQLGDVVVIAAGVTIDKLFRPCARYYLTFKEQAMLPHVALGLLGRGEEELARVEQEGED